MSDPQPSGASAPGQRIEPAVVHWSADAGDGWGAAGAEARAPGGRAAAYEVGDFRQGSPLSQWALARYLVGRAVADSVGAALLVIVAVVAVLAVLAQWPLGSTVLCVVLAVLAVGLLLMRWAMLAVLRRLTAWHRFGPLEQRVGDLVAQTRSDVLAELRRCGLPGRVWTLPLLAFRLLSRRRRPQTLERMRRFDVMRAVPRSRLDELHLVLAGAARGGLRDGAAR